MTPVAGPDSNAHHEQPMYSFSLSSNNRQCQQIPTAPLRASAFQQVSSGDPLRRRGSGPTTFDADIQPLRSNVGWPREPVNHPSPIPEPSYAYPPQSHSGQSTTSQAPLLDILDNVRKIRLNHPFPTRGRLRSLWSVRAKAVSELPTTTDHALRSPPNTSDFNSFTPPSQLTPQLTLNQSAFSISPLYLGALDTNSGTGIRQNAGTLDISSHISAIRTEVEPPPVYGTPEAPAPGYHVKQSPDTVAEQLFFYGFCECHPPQNHHRLLTCFNNDCTFFVIVGYSLSSFLDCGYDNFVPRHEEPAPGGQRATSYRATRGCNITSS